MLISVDIISENFFNSYQYNVLSLIELKKKVEVEYYILSNNQEWYYNEKQINDNFTLLSGNYTLYLFSKNYISLRIQLNNKIIKLPFVSDELKISELKDILSIKDAFTYILQNIELENIRNKIKKIQDNYTNIVSKLIINNNYKNLIYINKYVLCKKILYYYKNIYLYQLQNTLNEFKINYKNICKKLKLYIVISKIFNKNIYKTYFDIIKRCTFIEKSIKINETKNKKNINVLNIHFSFKFNSIYKNIRFQILYNQLMLSKYKLLINKYNNLIII